VRLYPNSSLRAEVELAIARSYLHERQWEPALQHYEAWLNRYSTNQLRSRAEFSYADANYQAGRLTNALSLFTNFVARFPNDPKRACSAIFRRRDLLCAKRLRKCGVHFPATLPVHQLARP
jgi:tetratricopeptide (TPR) repeat protein